jgi:hypothetical protein
MLLHLVRFDEVIIEEWALVIYPMFAVKLDYDKRYGTARGSEQVRSPTVRGAA